MSRRPNPEIERLERTVRLLQSTIDRMRADPGDVPFLACDNSCVCARPLGAATNGGCRCDERKLRRAVQYWRMVAQHRQAVIQTMREAPSPAHLCPLQAGAPAEAYCAVCDKVHDVTTKTVRVCEEAKTT